jgi:hypothetical protein
MITFHMEGFMTDEQQKNTSGIYEVKIQGQLDARWSEWFYDMAIAQDGDITTLRGPLPDQTVLHSVLDRIRDMNLQLISVNSIVSDGQTRNEK